MFSLRNRRPVMIQEEETSLAALKLSLPDHPLVSNIVNMQPSLGLLFVSYGSRGFNLHIYIYHLVLPSTLLRSLMCCD
jgi:hypothetical protein